MAPKRSVLLALTDTHHGFLKGAACYAKMKFLKMGAGTCSYTKGSMPAYADTRRCFEEPCKIAVFLRISSAFLPSDLKVAGSSPVRRAKQWGGIEQMSAHSRGITCFSSVVIEHS